VKNRDRPEEKVMLTIGSRKIAIGAILSILTFAAQTRNVAAQTGNVQYVNPYIGTGTNSSEGPTEYGNTMPYVKPPFGMTTWTAQTRQSSIGSTSYAYEDTNISGFIGTHQPAIWMGDYGYVTLMPEVGSIQTTPTTRQLPFTHSGETVTPYYYSVTMNPGSSSTIIGELTSTDHCAIMRFTYPANSNSSIVVEATRAGVGGGYVTVNANGQEIDGYNPDRQTAGATTLQLPNFKGYFAIQISVAFSSFGTNQGSTLQPGVTTASGTNVGAYATFSTASNPVVLVKVGTSFISIAQAQANLAAEIPNWDFNTIETNLEATWNQKLGEVTVTGGTSDQATQFYTAMFHGMQYPRMLTENGQYYSAFDDQVHSGVAYTDYSGWDIFRSEFSFLTVFCPERINDMIQALLNDYNEGGWMPKWPNPSYTSVMISTHADSMVAEAINKGFNGFNYSLAYAAVYKDATTPPIGDITNTWDGWGDSVGPYDAREGLTWYEQIGYMANDHTAEAASRTLEGAYEDWSVAQVAQAVANTSDYTFFLNRSLNYRNVFNPADGLMEARNSDGTWAGGGGYGFSEGGQGQYQFTVMHDEPGLVALMGKNYFNNLLTTETSNLNAMVNNEPGNHFMYLYDYSGMPWETQSEVSAALANFSNAPDGLPGNDDCGQISSWLFFANLGFYPVNPASGIYMIGSPLFPQVTLNLPNGNTFTITATNNSATNIYIQSATLNGVALNVPYITYAQIEAGGALSFVMGPSPSTWAADWSPTPISSTPSFILGSTAAGVPVNQGGTATSTITVAGINGFSGTVNLTATGLPSGVTGSFNPASVSLTSGSATSTLTLTASSSATPGGCSPTAVTVTGTSGSLTNTTAIGVMVGSSSSGSYNLCGIYTDGTSFPISASLDGVGYAYSSNLLGASRAWNGSAFTFGAANNLNVYSNMTITLPSGQYSTLNLLAAGVEGGQTSQTFTVNYTDGTTSTFTQSLSDWCYPQSFPGESQVATMSYRDTNTGGQDPTTNYLYGYSFSLDSSKTVQSLTLPNNRDVVVLGAVLAGGSATQPSYSLSAPATTTPSSVSPGGTSSATVTVTPANGYTGSVTLSCSISPVVTGTNAPTCSFGSTSPVSVTNGAATATLTFTTVGPSAAMFGPSGMFYAVFLPISGLALLGLCVGSGRSRGKMLVSILALWVLLAGVLVISSCGGGQGSSGNSGTPVGNYTVTITGTDASGKTQSNTSPPTVAINVT
jgi:predicted alpha-1,2-mannosidase